MISSILGSRALERTRPALIVAIAGLAATVALYIWIYDLQKRGLSAAALAMGPAMNMKDMRRYWSFPVLQASGLSGLAFAYVSLLLGLQQTGGALRRGPTAYEPLNRYHRYVALLVVGLVAVHLAATATDAMGDSWKTILIPGQWAQQGWPEAVFGYNLGIAAVFLLIVLGPTFYLRSLLGPTWWSVLHRLVIIFYILSVWHTLILGTDIAHYSWIRPAIWLLQIPVLLLFMRRLQRAMNERGGELREVVRILCRGLLVVSAITIIAILLLVITGRSGFIPTV